MRKLTLLLAILLAILSASSMKAQDKEAYAVLTSNESQTLTVCKGGYSSTTIPIYGLSTDVENTMGQVVYPAEKLADMKGSKISKLTFYTLASYAEETGDEYYVDSSIYFENVTLQLSLKEIEEKGFSEATAFTDATVVATAVPAKGDKELVFTFDEPFEYTGGNLLVEVKVVEKGIYGITEFWGDGYEESELDNCFYSYPDDDGDNVITQIGKFLPASTFDYENEGQTLTFYYDNKKAQRQTEVGEDNVYGLTWGTGGLDIPGWTSLKGNYSITTVTFDKSFDDYHGLENTSGMFYGLIRLTTINNLEYLHTEGVKTMSYMFDGCSSLETLDLSNFDTGNVEDMHNMFDGCKALASLDVSNFNTEKVTNMKLMFYNCKALTSLDVKNFNTSNVTDMSAMFSGCEALTSLDLSSFNTEKVSDMGYMFYNCYDLETIYCAEDADWSGVENRVYYGMFAKCTNLSGKCGSNEFPFDSNEIVGTYAKVYDGTNGGYFTYKGNRSYTLEVGEAKMATLYLDFDATIPKGVEVYCCTGLDDNEAYPAEGTTHAIKVENVLPANTGVFVKAAEGDYVFKAFIPVETAEETQVLQIYPDNILTGSTQKTTVKSLSVLTLGYAKNADKTLGFWWYTGTEIPAHRAYIPGEALTESGVKGIRIVFDDETSISLTPNPSPQGEGSWYSIDGRKMEGKPTQKGLYINNGRKVMVK